MSDDFVGVPRDDYRAISDRLSTLSNLVALLLLVVALLIWTLIDKGILKSVMDLFTVARPA